jgi:hypothetical protein
MFRPTEDPVELAEELREHGERWRAEHSDLTVVLLIHTCIRKIIDGLRFRFGSSRAWLPLKRRGDQLARTKSLFIAAEAMGHLPEHKRSAEVQKIRDELAVVIEEGSSLHKVRALRSMAFIASDECVPLIEKGLRDSSPWVQATALHILLRFNLRKKGPRGILINFLFNNFRESLRKSSVFSLSQIVRNFFLNKGLLVALSKEPGGRALAVLSAFLWAGSIVGAVLFAILYVVSKLLYGSAILVGGISAIILFGPIIVRGVGGPNISLRRGLSLWIVVDYALAAVIAVMLASRPPTMLSVCLGLLKTLTAVTVLHTASVPVNEISRAQAENVRGLMRSLLAAVALVITYQGWHDATLPLVVSLFAAVQFAWVAPWFIAFFRSNIAFFRSNIELIRKWAAVAGNILNSLVEAANKWINILASKLVSWVKSHAWKLARWAGVLGFVAAFLYYASSFLPESTVKGVEVQYNHLQVLLSPYFYLLGGIVVTVFNCGFYLFLLRLVWDEVALLNRARSRTLMRRRSHFKDPADFLAYVIQVVKNATNSVNLRTRAVLALTQIPLANPASVGQLMEVAEEDLPPKVRDALYQIIDAAEKRMQRGQMSSLNFDMEIISRQVEPILSPGSILRRRIIAWLCLLLLLTFLLGASRFSDLAVQPLTARVALAELAIGAALLLYYISTWGKISDARKWALMIGCGMLAVSWFYPLQEWLLGTTRPPLFLTFGVPTFDGGTARSLFVPILLFSIAAQISHTVYLLEMDVLLPEVKAAQAPIALLRRLNRLDAQPRIFRWVLLAALAAVAFQSMPLQEFIDLRDEGMPYFARNDETGGAELRDIPLDGRVIRVALLPVSDQNGLEPPLSETFPTAKGAYAQKDFDWSMGDEVWISSEGAEIFTWQIHSMNCLDFKAGDGQVSFLFLPRNCFSTEKFRLVAIVYNRRRARSIAEKATPENLKKEFEHARGSEDRLLADTLSPFARAVWGPFFESNAEMFFDER